MLGRGAGVGGEEVFDFVFQEFAAHPVEGAVDGAGFDGEAVAGIRDFVGPGAVGGKVAEVDGADGEFRGAAAGAGEAGDAEGIVGAKFFRGAGDHGDRGLGTDGAVLVEETFGHVEHLDLGVVGVGDHAAEKSSRGAGDVGKFTGEEAAGAGFSDGEGGFAGAKFVENDFGKGGMAEADEILVEGDAQFVADGFELGGAEVAGAGGNANIHLALMGTKGEAEAGILVDDGTNAMLDVHFRDAGDADLEVGVAGMKGAGFEKARKHLSFEHGAELIGRAGEHDENFTVFLQIDSRRGAKMVAKELGAARAEALLAVIGGHRTFGAKETFEDGGFGSGIEFEGEAKDLGDGLTGVVVGSGTEAAGGNDDVGGRPAIAESGGNVGGFVANDEIAADGEAMPGEFAAEEVKVGVSAEAEEEFVAEGQEIEFFHGSKFSSFWFLVGRRMEVGDRICDL